MKGLGVVLVLGLILCSVLAFAFWLRTPHRLVSQWPTTGDRGLEPADLISDHATR